jgi:DNA-directed RNA polymerase specialized sigma24 family protein
VVRVTLNGGVNTEQDVDIAEPDLTTGHQLAAGVRSRAGEPLPPEATGDRVVVGDIPVEPVGFQLRTGLLAELDRAGAGVSLIQAATGLHGLGVTQLAAAYARVKLEAGWRLVAWVNAAEAGSLMAGLAAVADATGLTRDGSEQGITDAAATVRRWLETDGDRCLLVFDDVPDPAMVAGFVPAHGQARVLITSARPSLNGSLNHGAVNVDVFSVAEASAFLAARTGLDDVAGAASVATALGHVPLALALATPVIAGQPAGYAGYLDRLRATSADASLTRDDGQGYPPNFTRAVLLSLQAVRAADRTGACTRVMEIMSVLSAAGVRRELLHAAGQAGVLTSGRHRVAANQVDRVLDWLSDRSLLTFSVDGQAVILPRVVARVIRNDLARRQNLMAVCETAAFVLDVYSRTLMGSPDRQAVREIPQQVTALLGSLAGPVTEVDEELAWLLLRLQFAAFYHLLELGDSTPQAIAVGEPLTEDLERLLGPDHPDTLNSRNSLAAAYLAAGRVAEAIPLFEQTLAVRQRTLGPDDPETLTSRNNLASAYQDAGRTAEAVQLYELNLEVRERVLGPDHPSTLNSRGNLARAFQDAGRAAEAIPLLERTLGDRERVLGPDHPDAQTSRKNLAQAYQDAGRGAEAVPLLERTLGDRERVLGPDHPDAQTSRKNLAQAYQDAGRGAEAVPLLERALGDRKEAQRSDHPESPTAPRNLATGDLTLDRVTEAFPPAGPSSGAGKSQPASGAVSQTRPGGLRRPPADPARRALPGGLRRPPADPVRRPLPAGIARTPAKPAARPAGRTQEPLADLHDDREVVAAIAAEDPAGVALAYDSYAADLYGYCHWLLHDSADAAVALQNTFVIAAAAISDLAEPAKLRPWLFALARSECRRQTRPLPAAEADEETDPVSPPADANGPEAHSPDAKGSEARNGVNGGASDATVTFRAINLSAHSNGLEVKGPEVKGPGAKGPDAKGPDAKGSASDATVTFRAISLPPRASGGPPAANGGASDATVTFRAIKPSPESKGSEAKGDATVAFQMVSLPTDATMPFRVVDHPADGPAHGPGDQGEAALRTLIYAILAGLKPREREVIELSFRHDLHDEDLAIALGTSWSRAHALATHARGRLEEALRALHIALTRREACPVLGELLTNWDGQLTEDTRDLVIWHIGECQTCAHHGWGALRPAAFSRLLPLAPLPPELRDQVLSCCTSATEDAEAYRSRTARRAESVWFTRFAPAIRHVSWAGVRANPGAAIVVAAVTIWVAAAVSILLVVFGGSRAAHAQTTRPAGSATATTPAVQTGAGTSSGGAAVAPAAAATSRSAAARPSPAVTQSGSYMSSPVQPLRSSAVSPPPSSSPSHSASSSPKPSKSPSKSPSAKPSPSTSPSSSPSASLPASSSPSPTA